MFGPRLVVCSLLAVPAIALADAPEDKLSQQDSQVLLDVTPVLVKDCPTCVTPGIDFDKKEVKVQPEYLKLRGKWISDLVKDTTGYGTLKFLKDKCGLKADPALKVDVAVAKLWRVNTLAEPMTEVLNAISGACGNPPSPSNQALAQKFKVIHFRLAQPWPQKAGHYVPYHVGHPMSGYVYGFDKKAGELTVGVHNDGTNIDDNTAEWFKKQ